MALVKFHKVVTLPGTLEANSFYYVENGTYAESYVTDDTGAARSIGNSAMINALITAAIEDLAVGLNSIEIVADIAARDALTAALDRNAMILVIDASADPTVDSGSALYAWDDVASEIYKIAEYESMDVVVAWSAITGGPVSTPANIDEAVTMRHTHANKTTLDKLSEDGDGLLFDAAGILSRWTTLNW